MNWTCELVEERLSDHLDGLLSAGEERDFAAHIEKCSRCSLLVSQVSGMLSAVHRVWPVEEPPTLVPQILEKTLGKRRLRQSRWPGWLAWIRPVLQPRFAVGLATVSLAALFTLQGMGVSLTDMRTEDLKPQNVLRNANRQAHLFYARTVKFVNDLRVVYEIQNRLEASRDTQNPDKPRPKNGQRQDRSRESNELLQRGVDLGLLASSWCEFSGRSLR